MLRFSSRLIRFAAAALFAAVLPSVAHAGASQVYGSQWAWNNDFNAAGQIGCSFGSGTSPNLTAWFNFGGGNLYGYPAAIRGYHYGWNPSGDRLFPFRVADKSSIPCYFSYSQGGSNMKGDFAYDMFLRWDSSLSSPQCEVMVWADHNSWPIGSCTAQYAVYTANRWFDLWEGYNSGAGYYVYSFVPSGSVKWPEGTLPANGGLNVDMKVFFNWLQTNRSGSGYYNNNMYLDVIEAGFEITGGNGWIWVQGDFNATTSGGGGGGGAPANGTYKIISQNSGKAMDANGAQTANGTQIIQWTYGGGNNQKWTLTNNGSWYSIRGVQSGKSIDINGWGTANDTKVQLWDYAGGTNQQFTFSDQGGGYYRITPNCATGSCLDVDGVSTADGAKVHLWQWLNGSNQKWSFQAP